MPLVLFLALLGFTPPAVAALILVPDQAPTIQDAITAAASGDSILVRAGSYAESLTLSGKDVTIFGESGAAATILTGSTTFRILDVAGAGVTTATVLADLTFRDGKAAPGAGIRMSGGASLTVRRCRFLGNRAEGTAGSGAAGGAAFLGAGSTLLVEDCLFQENLAAITDLSGGGLGGAIEAMRGAWLEVRSSEFMGNTASGFEGGFGGAIDVQGDALIEDCRFSGGFAMEGAAIRAGYLYDDGSGLREREIVIRRCVFDHNWASIFWGGAGIHCAYATMTIENNTHFANTGIALTATYSRGTIAHNTVADNNGEGIELEVTSQVFPTVSNNIIARNGPGVTVYGTPPAGSIVCNDVWGNVQGNYGGDCPDLTGIYGNLSADPLFCNAPARDFTLDARSPCAPAQSPPGCELIGAWPVACGVAAVDEVVPALPLRLAVHPNPIHGSATFNFDAGAGAQALEIHNSSGRQVAAFLASGRHAVTWQPSPDVPAGIYFATLTARTGRSETIKVAVLR